MGKPRQLASFLLPACAFLCAGCNNQDAERLGRIAQLIVVKWERATATSHRDLKDDWQRFCGRVDESALMPRVSARLHWDKDLAGAHIHVVVHDTQVELKGTVRDLAQRRRAVELAESTIGAEKVVDSLEVAPVE